jgi:hypothetical protein
MHKLWVEEAAPEVEVFDRRVALLYARRATSKRVSKAEKRNGAELKDESLVKLRE